MSHQLHIKPPPPDLAHGPASRTPPRKNRMSHQLHIKPPLAELAHGRIDQERHIVVGDFDHRDKIPLARLFQRYVLAADFRRTWLTFTQEIESPLGETAEIGGAIAQHILRSGAAIKLRDERRRNMRAAPGGGS